MKIDVVKMQILLGENGWNNKTLAQKSNVSRQTLSCINAGKTCSPAVACKLAQAFGVNVQEILKID